ncbi:hypothetical protein AB0P16_17830, partial [Dietzia maris]|uniref:hypothetical protein n=1 Tax=Dietzia maris TaxID=37915 RepID=UPI00342390C2
MRIRSIKPEFWRDEGVVNLSLSARLTFIGLWSYVDDNGVGDARVSSVIGDLYADDMSRDPTETLQRASGDIRELCDAGMIVRYTDPGNARRELLYVVNWSKHQVVNKPSKGHSYPLPPAKTLTSRRRSGGTPETLRTASVPEQGSRGAGEHGAGERTRPAGGTTTTDDTGIETEDEGRSTPNPSTTPPPSPQLPDSAPTPPAPDGGCAVVDVAARSKRFSPDTLADRMGYSFRDGVPVADAGESAAGTEPKGSPSVPRTAEEQLAYLRTIKASSHQSERSDSAPVETVIPAKPSSAGDKSLERMGPEELLDYIETFQREKNGVELSSGGPKAVATLKRFRADYGPQRAAAIIRELFDRNGGRYKVSKEVETITHRHFDVSLRWFTDKIDAG